MQKKIVIATRKSPLALWQAKFVKVQLLKKYPQLEVALLKITTEGDKKLHHTLAKIGGKGLFMKELEMAMQQGLADIAVHSVKDVPYQLPAGFELGAILVRENPFDAFVSSTYDDIDDLPKGAVVGTCSLRRQVQLLALRPDLKIRDLRGNVNTRLKKLDSGDYDAVILACAGLIRLGLERRIRTQISAQRILPAVGQGAIGIEIRVDNIAIKQLIAPLIDSKTTRAVLAERAMNARLKGSCTTPIAGFATTDNGYLSLTGLVGNIRDKQIIKASTCGNIHQGQNIGEQVADKLLAKGAKDLLRL